MRASTIREKISKEIERIPDENVHEIFDLLHYYRLGLNEESSNPQKTLELAGSWKDMPKEEFDEFINNIKIRRSRAFRSRGHREAGTD
ncbi:MAG: hypothetical protein U5R06_14970 [candidate division KSB1 bacterium]|nr:hypothetical protein [candidate division KSB1 bacterium]